MKKENGYVVLTGPIISEGPNANGDMFTKECMEKAVRDFKEHKINTGLALGEMGKPQSRSAINLKQVSHKITDLNIVDDKLEATIEPIPYPNLNGELLKMILEVKDNDGLNFQPRMIGDKLISIDILPPEK